MHRDEHLESETSDAHIRELIKNEKNQISDQTEVLIKSAAPKPTCDGDSEGGEEAVSDSADKQGPQEPPATETAELLTTDQDESHSETRMKNPGLTENPCSPDHKEIEPSQGEMAARTVALEPKEVTPTQLVEILSRAFSINVASNMDVCCGFSQCKRHRFTFIILCCL